MQDRWADRLRAFQALIAADSETLSRQVHNFLAMAAEQFQADFCTALRIDGDQFTVLATHGSERFQLREGDKIPVDSTFAQQVLITRDQRFQP